MNDTITLNIWGRELPIEVVYDCFENEEVDTIQKDTFEIFMAQHAAIFDSAYVMLEQYCAEKYPDLIPNKFDNIFKYIKPKTLYIKKSTTKRRIAGVLCNFKFDLDHGLAIYIDEGKVTKVGSQDIIL